MLAGGAIGVLVLVRLDVGEGLLNRRHPRRRAGLLRARRPSRHVRDRAVRFADRYVRGLRMEDSALALVELEDDACVALESDIAGDGFISATT